MPGEDAPCREEWRGKDELSQKGNTETPEGKLRTRVGGKGAEEVQKRTTGTLTCEK